MGLVQGNVWGVSMDQKFLKDTPQFYSFSSVVHAEFCWICGLFPVGARERSLRICMCARACARTPDYQYQKPDHY